MITWPRLLHQLPSLIGPIMPDATPIPHIGGYGYIMLLDTPAGD